MDSEIMKTKNCKLCNNEFTVNKPNKLFCSTKCQQKHYSNLQYLSAEDNLKKGVKNHG